MPTKVKEEIVLKNKKADIDKLIFKVETDLELKLNEDRSIIAVKDNETYFKIEAPYMIDANQKTNNNVYYELTFDKKEYQLKPVLDKEWLNSKDIKYPVTIDPTITNHGQNNSVYDTYIYPGDTGINRNDQDVLKAGVEKVGGIDRVNRTLIKFDLPTIATGSQIVNASLDLVGYPVFPFDGESQIVEVHRVTSPWDEATANWNNMNDKYSSRVEACSLGYRSWLFPYVRIEFQGFYADITDLVKKWYTDTPNYGIMLKANNEVYIADNYPAFYSKDNLVEGDPKPILVITYRNQNGLENYMKYLSHSFSEGSTHINVYNGNLTSVFDIGSTREGKMPASLNLVYNTNDVVLNNNIGYGLGYQLSLSQTIKKTIIDEITYLEYVDEDGTIHYFQSEKEAWDDEEGIVVTADENTYYDEDGLELKIIDNKNDYTLIDNNGDTIKFNKINNVGYLTEITDVSNNKITVYYNENNLISKIKDADQVEINLVYDSNTITVISPDDTVILTYSNNQLVNMTGNMGTKTFAYNGNNILTSITDVNDKKIAYSYYDQTPYRLKKVTEYGTLNSEGKSFEVFYNFSSTTITDNKNRATTMTFNSYGNVESTTNLKSQENIKNGYGISNYYGEMFQYKNKLESTGIPLMCVKNLINDSGFEGTNLIFTPETNVTLTISNETCFSGYKSLKTITSAINKKITKTISVPKDSHYTFSTYLKNTNNIKLALSYLDESAEMIEVESEVITSNSDFTRYDVTINYPGNATSDLTIKIIFLTTGTTYLDDIQLEKGEVANYYNFLDNSDFADGLNDWVLEARDYLTGEDIPTTNKFEIANLEEGLKAIKIKMNPGYSTSIEKTFNIPGKAGDIYTISFWYKNEGVVVDGGTSFNNVIVNFWDPDNEEGQGAFPSTPLNPNLNEWQYFSYSFTALNDYETIDLIFFQELNANDLYITNISLYKDVREIYYDYDANGNITETYGLNNESDTFNYDKNNQLTKMTNPRGKNFTFEYDNIITDRVLNGTSATGISNKVKYDSNNNPITTKIENKNNIVDNGTYTIRLKGTDKYLKLLNNKISIISDTYEYDKWILEKITIAEENYFRIKHKLINNKYLTIKSNTLILTSEQTDDSLFSLIKNDNNSYLIKSKANNNYLKNNNDQLIVTTLEEDNYNYEFYFEKTNNKKFIENNSTYTEDGRFLTSTTDSLLNKTTYITNPVTGLVTSTTNAKNITTDYTYNNKKQLTNVSSVNKSVTYDYDNQDMLSKISEGNKEYNFNYDEFLNIESIDINNNLLIENIYEENNGNLISSIYGNEHVVGFDYDEFDRISKTTKMNDIYNYKYDGWIVNTKLYKLNENTIDF